MSGKSALLLTMLSNTVQVHPKLTLNLIRILVALSCCHRQWLESGAESAFASASLSLWLERDGFIPKMNIPETKARQCKSVLWFHSSHKYLTESLAAFLMTILLALHSPTGSQLFPVQIQDFAQILWNPSVNFPVTIYKGTLTCLFLIEATQPPSSDRAGVLCMETKRVLVPKERRIYRKKDVREAWVGFQLGYRKRSLVEYHPSL